MATSRLHWWDTCKVDGVAILIFAKGNINQIDMMPKAQQLLVGKVIEMSEYQSTPFPDLIPDDE